MIEIEKRMKYNKYSLWGCLFLTAVFASVLLISYLDADVTAMILCGFFGLLFWISSSAIGQEIEMDKRILEQKGGN